MITIEQERFNNQLAGEMLPLAQKGWDECTDIKGATCAYFGERALLIEPDMDGYEAINQQGILVLITLRDGASLKGYLLGFTYPSLHHKRILCGIGDAIYVDPQYRTYTPILVDKFETVMRSMSVEIIGWPTNIDGPVHEVLKARGYVGDEIVMEKRLGKISCVLQ